MTGFQGKLKVYYSFDGSNRQAMQPPKLRFMIYLVAVDLASRRKWNCERPPVISQGVLL